MKIECFNIGQLGTNCYCVSGEDYAFIIDPADVDDAVLDFAKANKEKKYKYILLTHCHIDHIIGTEAVKEIWNCPVVISESDAKALMQPEYNLSRLIFREDFCVYADLTVKDKDELNLGAESIQVLATPGHTPGSVCYILGDNMFSGDTLFKGTIGRTDFPRSNQSDMLNSLSILSKLETDYKVYPGHEDPTTLFYEKKYNPFMR